MAVCNLHPILNDVHYSECALHPRSIVAPLSFKLHEALTSFETRPAGAPQDEDENLMASPKNRILSASEASSRRTHELDPAVGQSPARAPARAAARLLR